MITIAIAFDSKDSARKMAKLLLKEKAIACANIFPVESIYTWKDELCEETEYFLLCKTIKEKYQTVSQIVEKNHSYDTPLIEAWDIDFVNKKYEDWMKKEIQFNDD